MSYNNNTGAIEYHEKTGALFFGRQEMINTNNPLLGSFEWEIVCESATESFFMGFQKYVRKRAYSGHTLESIRKMFEEFSDLYYLQ
jgi:hypothetical protein